MCGRYTLFSEIKDLSVRFSIPENLIVHYPKNYNISPNQYILAIMSRGDNTITDLVKWGLKPSFNNEHLNFKAIHNARAETIQTKPTFKQIIKTQRCIIPTNGFYEWQKTNNGIRPFFIHKNKNELFALAGIWTTEIDFKGAEIRSCSILTKKAAPEFAKIHHRMPVVLQNTMEKKWINNHTDLDSLMETCLNAPSEQKLYVDEVSHYVNCSNNSGEDCIVPTPKLL